MRNATTAVKTREITRAEDTVDVQVSKVSFTVMAMAICAIGAWAAVTFVAGIVASGGPISLITKWFIAVSG
jgi:hypothetical protein